MKTTLLKTAILTFFITVMASFGNSAPEVYAGNPCGGKKMVNPCNPCSTAPVVQIRPTQQPSIKKLVKQGEKEWNNEALGSSGFTCMTCHDDHEILTNRPWPHHIKMSNDVYTLDQMINFCLLNPMDGKKIDPLSQQMTAMAAFYTEYMKSWKPSVPASGKANPCNPCGGKMKNPCNPCGR